MISHTVEEVSFHFACAFVKYAHSAFLRWLRPAHVPFVDADCSALLKHYEESRNADFTGHLIEPLDRQRWKECTSEIDFTGSSPKSRCLIESLGVE